MCGFHTLVSFGGVIEVVLLCLWVTCAIPAYPNRGNAARGRPSILLFPRIRRRALDA